jgi:membrane protein DedA with SNARE-associated domain
MDVIFQAIQNFWLSLQNGVLPRLGNWNYVLLAVVVAIEGPIATLLGSAAASAGLMKLPLVFVFACVGNLSADLGWYFVGYTGKIEWIFHIGRFFGVKLKYIDRLKEALTAHARKIIFVAKLTNGLMVPSLIAAGLAKIPLRRWLPALVLAETIWTGTLVMIGFYATEAIKQVEKGVEYIGYFSTALLLLVFIYLAQRAIRHNKVFAGSVIIDDDDAGQKKEKQGKI